MREGIAATMMLLDSSKQSSTSPPMAGARTLQVAHAVRWLMVIALFVVGLSTGGQHDTAGMAPSDSVASIHAAHTSITAGGEKATVHDGSLLQPDHASHTDCCAEHQESGASCGAMVCCPCDLTGGIRSPVPIEVSGILRRPRSRPEFLQPATGPVDKPPRLV